MPSVVQWLSYLDPCAFHLDDRGIFLKARGIVPSGRDAAMLVYGIMILSFSACGSTSGWIDALATQTLAAASRGSAFGSAGGLAAGPAQRLGDAP